MGLFTQILKQNRPDITLLHKDTQEWILIDIAVPADQNIITTDEKDLVFEIRKIQSLESDSYTNCDWCTWKHLEKRKGLNGKLDLPDIFGNIQLLAIFRTAHLLQRVLCL